MDSWPSLAWSFRIVKLFHFLQYRILVESASDCMTWWTRHLNDWPTWIKRKLRTTSFSNLWFSWQYMGVLIFSLPSLIIICLFEKRDVLCYGVWRPSVLTKWWLCDFFFAESDYMWLFLFKWLLSDLESFLLFMLKYMFCHYSTNGEESHKSYRYLCPSYGHPSVIYVTLV